MTFLEHDSTTGHVHSLARHVSRTVAQEKRYDAGHIFRFFQTPKWNRPEIIRAHLFWCYATQARLPCYLALLHGGTYITGADGIDSNTICCCLKGKCLCEADDREFRGGIMGQERRGFFACHGGGINNATSFTLL